MPFRASRDQGDEKKSSKGWKEKACCAPESKASQARQTRKSKESRDRGNSDSVTSQLKPEAPTGRPPKEARIAAAVNSLDIRMKLRPGHGLS